MRAKRSYGCKVMACRTDDDMMQNLGLREKNEGGRSQPLGTQIEDHRADLAGEVAGGGGGSSEKGAGGGDGRIRSGPTGSATCGGGRGGGARRSGAAERATAERAPAER